jgi:hypothetical protein
MEQSKAQQLHKKIDGLGEGMARRMMEVYNELANNRFIVSTLVHQNLESYPEVNEEDILENIQDYFLVTDKVAIYAPDENFVRLHLITRNYKMEDVTEEGKFTFKYQGIITDENVDHTVEATNEQHAWQLLREILINNEKNKQE